MSLIKTTIIESLFYQFFKLDPTRPSYYFNVYNFARSILVNLDFTDNLEVIENLIKEEIEYKYKTDFVTLVHVYDNCISSMNKGAYVRIGSGIESQDVGVYEIKRSLEKIKLHIQDDIIKISREIRFSKQADMVSE